jgi:hypothetical protein
MQRALDSLFLTIITNIELNRKKNRTAIHKMFKIVEF